MDKKPRILRRQIEISGDFSDTVHPLLRPILLARGVRSDAEYATELKGLLKPEMKGLPEAAALLADALERNRRILVVGDFDADGATSTALALLALRDMGAQQVDFLVPNRFEYGYGLSPEIVAVARQSSPELIVTVDNGISSIDGVAAANALGIEVLVTDHHLPGDALPDAAAIVNPNQPGCPFAAKSLAGVGVMFYVLSALRNELRARDWFASRGIAEPNLGNYLDLVALGTVADVVPLEQNNRILVEQGLRRIRAGRARPGIRALLQVAGRNHQRLVASDLGFAVGPRLNAAGRLDDMSLGIRCLLTADESEALRVAAELDELNRERRAIEQSMQQDALRALERVQLGGEDGEGSDDELPFGICLFDDTWHQGVVGILASRIKEKYHRPVIAFAEGDNGLLKGSGRSIPGVHMRDVLDLLAKRHPDMLEKFGGHAMAAGLSLPREHYPRFAEAFDALLREQLEPTALTATLHSDGELPAPALSLETAQLLRDAGPWGQQFPEPLFDGVFRVINQRLVGERHLKLVLAPDDAPQQAIDAIAFNIDTRQWPCADAQRLQLVYKLDVNEFRGRVSPQLLVEHLEVVS